MQKVVRFINCTSYDFVDKDGKRVTGISCKCFDEDSKSIIKVKTSHLLDKNFGDEVLVNVLFNGRFVNYEIAE
ncbi:MAG: hypothetical protein J1E36_03825 [Eubacterium sp.]|nr:hypothetical protein [Eubacterium sp.]